jgi:hypothetical protein
MNTILVWGNSKMPKVSVEVFELKQAQLQWTFDRKREKIMRDSYKEIDKAWKDYQAKLRGFTIAKNI